MEVRFADSPGGGNMVKPSSGSHEEDSARDADVTRPGRQAFDRDRRESDETLAGGSFVDDTPVDLTQANLSLSDTDPDQTRAPRDLSDSAFGSGETILSSAEAVTAPGRLAAAHPPTEEPSLSSIRDPERTGAGVDTIVAGGPEEGPLAPGHAFGSRYHIVSVIGVGGMGAVYRAWDKELGVLVALKVIRPEVAADPEAARALERRFKQELLLARQVTHRNVVRIHDLGEVHGIKYITMPFIEGEDLSSVLKREGSLAVSRIMPIARTMVSGLVAAHKAGIVHRDLKPANIMVDKEGEAMVMDFGVARSAGPADDGSTVAEDVPAAMRAAAKSARTVVGSVVGTIDYMAPEQARAQPVDQRADIYAVGLILYDLLLGRKRHEHANSAIAELQERMQNAPQAPRQVNPAVPEALDKIVARCLQPDPAARFQTTEELEAALNRLNDEGRPLPVIRRLTRRMVVGVGVLVVALVVGAFFTAKWLTAPVKPHDPVSVVIADFQNTTNDPTFGQTIGQTVRRALEDARFISAYDRTRIRTTFGVPPPAKFDEVAARQLAVKQGLGVVLAGSIAPSGDGYDITIKAAQTITNQAIATFSDAAAGKDQVLETTTRLVARVRRALGDRTSESAQLFAMRTLSTSSLDVVSHYAAAMDAQSNLKYEDARQHLLKAVGLDPKFGLGYQGLAVTSRNLERPDDADKYIKEALRYLDGMTERERFSVRGFYYRMIGDYQQCAKEYGDLIQRYSADAIARNGRAVCLVKLRNMREAVEEMRQIVQLLPNQQLMRTNLALFMDLAGDFEGAEREIQKVQEPDFRGVLVLAYSQVGRGLMQDAAQTYERLGTMGTMGGSYASAGLADLNLYEGRFSDAIAVLDKGAAADLASKSAGRAAIKLTSIAYAHLMAGRNSAAVGAAEKALANSTSMPVRFLAARIFALAGQIEKARPMAAALSSELPAEPRAFGKIIEGLIALQSGNASGAVTRFTEANGVLDTWFGHFDLARAYLEAGAFLQADSELDRCIARRGETLSLMDEGPTSGHFPLVYYYQGRVREELKTAGFADSYRKYLEIRGSSTEDPRVPEVKKRLGTAVPPSN